MEQVIAINRFRQALIVSIQIDLSTSLLDEFEVTMPARLSEEGVRGVLIDLSGIKTCGCDELVRLLALAKMVEMMGRHCIFVGLRPGLVMGMLDVGIDTSDMVSVSSLEQGMALL
ncbi:STAS domain-containing protein [Aeromonas sp. MdU4]|uniref:STAS domain-containing protein n=1 Tax=Aeromonas sp. MdU4 TaxID=3342819 RepID=UPI0035BA3778